MRVVLRKLMLPFRSLSVQFFLGGGLVMILAAYAVGTWVSNRIEQGVVRNSGASAALYIESLIPSQTFDIEDGAGISASARQALQQVFQDGILRDSIVTYNIWSEDGEVLDSFRPELRGRTYEPSEALLTAWSGEVASQFQNLEIQAEHPDSTLGIPMLEVYVPIRDARTGEVLTVVEFYQRAEDLATELLMARRDSWKLIIQIFGLSWVSLFLIVHAGSRMIERQREQVKLQLVESLRLSKHNEVLRERVAQAAQRAAAQSEKIMQRIGHDLHDGVAQHLSLASLRLEGAGLAPSGDAEIVKKSLSNAMTELRAISRGLALPDLAILSLTACAAQAVNDHNKSFGSNATLDDRSDIDVRAPYATKLCVYRFLQEALANATRHADATILNVQALVDDGKIEVTVSDNGRGFDQQSQTGLREDGGQGLPGLADRAETLNGKIEIHSNIGVGTTIRLVLPFSEETE